MKPLFRKIDCISLPVPDLETALTFYHRALGHEIVWRDEEAVGLKLPDDDAELVLHRSPRPAETDILVESIPAAVDALTKAGAELVAAPFEIRIGRCAVLHDPWGNRLVLLDDSKGTLAVDPSKRVIGLALSPGSAGSRLDRPKSETETGPAVEIRDASQADAEALAELVDTVARERRFLAATVGFGVEATRSFISTVISSGGVQLIAHAAGQAVGWCDILPQTFEGMGHVGRLGMGVRQGFRGRGIGRALLEGAIRKAFTTRIRRIELEVFASNDAAIRLYESAGFNREGRKVRARLIDDVSDDLLLYALL